MLYWKLLLEELWRRVTDVFFVSVTFHDGEVCRRG